MVYIKEMVLENFKSFKGKHHIPFHQGFTGITGLNGSGKSNIVDAAQFVMGTRSSRVIRARRLSELIFNGGKQGNPAGYCQVSLTFDNEDRELPVDADEVVFTKKVKISKGSQAGYNTYYYLNDRASTNGEFERILEEAGIYVDGYNVVKQGDVTDITRMGMVERRKILDRVERIDSYDKSIEKSREECKQIDENIERMRFILTEKENALTVVEKERESALRYQELGKEKTLLEAKTYKKQMLDMEARIQHLGQQIAKFIQDRQNLDMKKEEAEGRLRNIEDALEEMDKKIMEIGGKEAEELKKKVDQIRMKLVALRENNKNDEAKIQDLKAEIKRESGNLGELQKQNVQRLEQSSSLHKELLELRTLLQGREARLRHVNELLGKKDKRSLEVQRDIAQAKKELDELNSQLHEKDLQHDKLVQRREATETELDEINDTFEHMSFQIEDAEMALKDLRSRMGSQGETKKELEKTLYELRTRLMDYRRDLNDIDKKIRSLERERTQMEGVQQMDKKISSGYSRPVHAVMEAKERGLLSGIHGTPLELGKVDKKYEPAIQALAGGGLQSIIVSDDAVAEEAIAFLKKNNFGRATFIPLNKIIPPQHSQRARALMGQPGVVGFAEDLMDFDDRFYKAFAYICKGAVVLEKLSFARRYMGHGMPFLVTIEGDVINPRGAMTGGSSGRQSNRLSFSGSSGRDLEAVTQEIQKLRGIEQNLNSQIERSTEDIAEIERDLGEYKGNIDENEIRDLETRRNHYLSRKQAMEGKLTEKKREVDSLNEELNSGSADLEAARKRQEELKLIIKENGELLLKSADKKIGDEIRQLREELEKAREQERDILSKQEVGRTQQELTGTRIAEIEQDLSLSREAIDKAGSAIQERLDRIGLLEVEEKTLVEMEFKISAELEGFREEKSNLIKKESDLRHRIEGFITKGNTFRELIQDTKFKIPHLEEQYREFEAEYNAVGIMVEGELETLEYLKRKLRDTDKKMRDLEPVNMMAIHQYEEIKERIVKVTEEIEDSESEKNMLLELIEKTLDKKRVRFEKVFTAVNENFGEIFHELSGGDGELILDNPDDPLGGGLDIKARPRGKNPLRVDSLSGGEKSLTAIAFILSIQNYSPAPFYFFDEADMFLDSANSMNIASTIQKYTRHNQFIMISLKEIVLSQADHHYGVWMNHDLGASNWNSMPREEALSMARQAEAEEDAKKEREKEDGAQQTTLPQGGGV